MLVAISLVIILAWNSLNPITENNGFTRNLIYTDLQPLYAVEKSEDVSDISGSTSNRIFFKTKNPSKVYSLTKNLQQGKYEILNIPNNAAISSLFTCIVDSPYTYIAAGNARIIIKAKSGDSSTIYKLPESVFLQTVLLSNNLVAMRMFKGLNPIFAKRNLSTGELTKGEDIFNNKNDAGIGSDGELRYDKTSNLLIYVEYYNNQAVFMDSNMNIVKKIKTIDINIQNLLKTDEIGSKGILTNTSPKRMINRSSSVVGGYLFICSRLKADNETNDQFRNNTVVDMYNIKSGLRENSFYIPEYKREKSYSFKIIDDLIFALYKNHIVAYKLPFNLVH